MDQSNELGSFLRERRARLDPAAFGMPLERERTPGPRREEVAQLAHVSPTWYTWLEQGRGGAPSADVLDRLARALGLSAVEREHLYLLAQHRPPRVALVAPSRVTPQLRRVLDAFGNNPALIKSPEWTILAWNRAAHGVLGNFAEPTGEERNLLRNLFLRGQHGHLSNWEDLARMIVGSVRRDLMRTGMSPEVEAFIAEVSAGSALFRSMWESGEVALHNEGSKQIAHPVMGVLNLEFSTFAVDGAPDLGLVVFNPVGPEDRQKLRTYLAE
ncbi:helix-turn-helix transcriptional regulator [Devosia sp. BK]|uniref:helix-turn-helix transcriptional regulator n=1 Tax=Devosia sp. BK TaxID=2871706 RepID=UPI00293B8E52|nr:helix-turn-helix transcriptional regulator [Devosia sp. BK]